MNRLLSSVFNLLLVMALGVSLSGCVTTRLPVATASPWQAQNIDTEANPLDVAFTDANHGFLVGSNRMIQETDDGGASWNERSLDLPDEENFRLISIDHCKSDLLVRGGPRVKPKVRKTSQTHLIAIFHQFSPPMEYFQWIIGDIEVLHPFSAFCNPKNGFLGPKG